MKTKNVNLKGIVLGALLFLGASSAFATGNIKINPYLDTDLSIVSIINPSESALKMKIYDREGNLYYSKKVNRATTDQKLFDFSYLEDGIYKIVLSGAEENVEKEFIIEGKKLKVTAAKEVAEKTLFRSQDNNLFVSYLSFENDTFNLSITDELGNEVFEESYTSAPTFSKKFNVTALPEGEYKVRLVSNNKEYNYAFRK
ncbi:MULTISPECIES: T9SS C-terminal target domain-containing protein [Marinifilum]|uniref:T9SS C-terminal target domain-containing protein n=1 Tax=Marinifilum TaxID=866673 RepID=UPI002272AEE5|nr:MULTISPECIES: T9SS C-terminal target domain-containing protein [Marinifilum]MCY1636344.1 T9SS C-terminal target domain-containing protein [Marinifilum sp. D737]